MNYYLGIDLGTSGTKTVLFSSDGKPVASHTVEYPLFQPHNGWAEQDPQDWWNASVAGIQAVIAGIPLKNVKGVGISGQMHGLVMLGKSGEVLRPSIIWCDQRTARECDEITQKVGAQRLIEITANPALTGFTASKILWVKNNEPEVFAKCAHIMLPKDYIRYKLTGEFASEVSDASGMQLLDVPNRCWSDEVLGKLDIDKSLLCALYESVEVTGSVHQEASQCTGLLAGTPVVGGAGDNFAAAIGTGTVLPGRAFTTLGTSGVVFAYADKVSIDPKGRVHSFCSAVPGKWTVMSCTQSAGLSLQWLRNVCCTQEVNLAKEQNTDPYILMDDLAKDVPIGAEKLLYLPYLMGERSPHLNPNCRGVFFGLSAMHTRAHLIRAVMEGVSYSQMDCVNVFAEMGVDISDMMVCGGGGKSPFWRQMLSDVYGIEVSTLHADEGPALGVAILAMVAAGEYATVQEACGAIVKKGKTHTPIAASTETYAKFYGLYRKLYGSLKNDFETLAEL